MKAPTTPAPRIGQPWPEQGGIYAGVMAGRDGQPDYHLILSPAELGEIKAVIWGAYDQDVTGAASYYDGQANTRAMVEAACPAGVQIAKLQIDGHADWHLPSQAEAHLLAANLKDHFRPTWYWTSTQYSDNLAWLQTFYNGNQSYYGKGAKARARAVRLIHLSA